MIIILNKKVFVLSILAFLLSMACYAFANPDISLTDDDLLVSKIDYDELFKTEDSKVNASSLEVEDTFERYPGRVKHNINISNIDKSIKMFDYSLKINVSKIFIEWNNTRYTATHYPRRFDPFYEQICVEKECEQELIVPCFMLNAQEKICWDDIGYKNGYALWYNTTLEFIVPEIVLSPKESYYIDPTYYNVTTYANEDYYTCPCSSGCDPDYSTNYGSENSIVVQTDNCGSWCGRRGYLGFNHSANGTADFSDKDFVNCSLNVYVSETSAYSIIFVGYDDGFIDELTPTGVNNPYVQAESIGRTISPASTGWKIIYLNETECAWTEDRLYYFRLNYAGDDLHNAEIVSRQGANKPYLIINYSTPDTSPGGGAGGGVIEAVLEGASLVDLLEMWNNEILEELRLAFSQFQLDKDPMSFLERLWNIIKLLFKFILRQPGAMVPGG